MEFDKKTVASIVVGAVIIVAILVYFVLLVGQASPASNAYEETGGHLRLPAVYRATIRDSDTDQHNS